MITTIDGRLARLRRKLDKEKKHEERVLREAEREWHDFQLRREAMQLREQGFTWAQIDQLLRG